MYTRETAIVKLRQPMHNKANWLKTVSMVFADAVSYGLEQAQSLETCNRAKLHKAVYHQIRAKFGLSAEYARMVVNTTVAMAASYYGLRKSKRQKRTSFPTVRKSQGIGLGVNGYRIKGTVLRVSTNKRNQYIWLPLCVSSRIRNKLQYVYGDAKLFQRGPDWYVMLPLRIPHVPTVRDGEPTFIGIDLGIVRLATVSTPNGVTFFDGKAIRHQREHFADIRKRYQRHGRRDRVKEHRGKESRWMTDINHKISKAIVDIALQYGNPVIVFEKLDGIRDRLRASKRFNRMMSSWAFRQLINFVLYKAERVGILVLFTDPRRTSRTCPVCGHATRSNRPSQSQFRCVKCKFHDNADSVASANIAGGGASLYYQERPDTARRFGVQTRSIGFWPDGVNDCRRFRHSNSNLVSS
jgi:IS605 OrfB family transposase